MVSIYFIQDVNGLVYFGSTTISIERRFKQHIRDKEKGKGCSSIKLDLDSSVYYEIEKCSEENRKERERFWINNNDCVNEKKLNFSKSEYQRQYQREYRKKNKDKINKYQRDRRKNLKSI
jgi:predicted GIY-YIG superfamily endonuclease